MGVHKFDLTAQGIKKGWFLNWRIDTATSLDVTAVLTDGSTELVNNTTHGAPRKLLSEGSAQVASDNLRLEVTVGQKDDVQQRTHQWMVIEDIKGESAAHMLGACIESQGDDYNDVMIMLYGTRSGT